MEKFLKVGKLNSFPILNSFSGNALLVFANNRNNYTVNVSEVSGADALKVDATFPVAIPGEELIIDGQEISIKIQSDSIDAFNGGFREWEIKAKYGKRGDKGIEGPIGERGDQGLSAFEANNITEGENTLKIVNNVETDENNSLLSALQGNLINSFVKKHNEMVMSSDDYAALINKETNKVYYTIDEQHPYTGKKYTLSGNIEWDAPVYNEDYSIKIDNNGNLSIGGDAAKVENHVLVLTPDVAEIVGNTLIIKKVEILENNSIDDSTLVFGKSATLDNHEVILKASAGRIENGTLILNK